MNSRNTEGAHALVVDDHAETLSMLSAVLESAGMTVAVAESGFEALRQAVSASPDIVIMDAMMSGMDGFQTCRILKQEKGFTDVPVVFMTGFDETEHMARAFESGAVDYIAKPIDIEELTARVRVHLTNARRSRSAREALDRTGRRIVACDATGAILWSTPQAAELMAQNGLRNRERDPLPSEVICWLDELGTTPASAAQNVKTESQFGSIEFRIVEQAGDNELLLRLIDASQGPDEEQLARAFNLTPREADVLLWITHGKSNKEIGEILTMSPRTVNKHLEQVFTKLGVENRTAAATSAVRALLRHG